ncbi:hypothetical protein NUACC26_086430 [Scytonema sp. NUACC26]
MNRLYYVPNSIEIKEVTNDANAEIYALRLTYCSTWTSNYLVVLAAKVLVREGKIEPFTLVWYDGTEYAVDKSGRIEHHPDCIWDELLDRLF